jgi:SAM-dependent methyltransferase
MTKSKLHHSIPVLRRLYLQRDDARIEKDEALNQRDEALKQREEAFNQRDSALEERDKYILQRDDALNEREEIIRLLDEFSLQKYLRTLALPPEFDARIYRKNPDVSHLDHESLTAHFVRYGREEGRLANTVSSRREFVKLIQYSQASIEFGPFSSPQLVGPRVSYFDVLDRRQLIERAERHGIDSSNTPNIDFVSPNGDLGIVDKEFDVAFSSHCIEHQPDLITHLQNVERILRPEGRYFLVIPDKRYCFDYFLSDSSLSDIVGAYVEKRRTHDFTSFFEHRLLLAHNDPALHWRGEHGRCQDVDSEGWSRVTTEWANAAGAYIDVHAWRFTPQSFRSIIQATARIGLHHFKIERVYATIFGTFEFFVVLRRQ